MGLNVNGDTKVYNMKVFDKFISCSVMQSRKLQTGEWQNKFFNAKFVGKS